MTALQLNTDIYRSLGVISEDENVLRRVAKYLTRVAKQMTDDPTCMSKEEFFARVDEAERQIEQGKYTVQLPGESVEDMLKRCGLHRSSNSLRSL